MEEIFYGWIVPVIATVLMAVALIAMIILIIQILRK